MKCRNCKYKNDVANTGECNKGLCSYPTSWFPIDLDDDCHFIPKVEELKCKDCWHLHNDYACFSCDEEDSAYDDGELCWMFEDLKKDDFSAILMFWKTHGLYDREKINEMLDDFEKRYRELTEQ